MGYFKKPTWCCLMVTKLHLKCNGVGGNGAIKFLGNLVGKSSLKQYASWHISTQYRFLSY